MIYDSWFGGNIMKAAILFICCFVLFSCSKHKLVEDFEKLEIPESAAGIKEFHIESKEEGVGVRQKNANAKLVYAENLTKLGDYELAIDIYQKIYDDIEYKDNQRDNALFKLGEVYECVLYEDYDYIKAIGYYNLIISEFPASEHRFVAYDRIELLRLEIEERELNK